MEKAREGGSVREGEDEDCPGLGGEEEDAASIWIPVQMRESLAVGVEVEETRGGTSNEWKGGLLAKCRE